jgi:hypothetical protein
VAQAVEIREVSWSNFGEYTEYLTEEFSGFPQTLQASVEIEFKIGKRPHFTMFYTSAALTIL